MINTHWTAVRGGGGKVGHFGGDQTWCCCCGVEKCVGRLSS